jgi:hypothetical protein
MKYICLAYQKRNPGETMSESERDLCNEQWFADHNARSIFLSEQAVGLQKNKLSITDGPFAETKEQMG